MGVGNVVSRDIYISFWKEAANSLFIRETERVPYVRHDLFKYEWEAIGKILLKGYIDTEYFPVILSKTFVPYTLFGEVGVDDLLSSLFLYLPNDEANMLKGLLAEESGIDDFSSNEFYEFLEQFEARSLVTMSNIKDKLAEVARQELIQKSHIMTACWKPMFNFLREEYHFNCKSHVFSFYDKVTPSNKKMLQLLKSNPKEERTNVILSVFSATFSSRNLKVFF